MGYKITATYETGKVTVLDTVYSTYDEAVDAAKNKQDNNSYMIARKKCGYYRYEVVTEDYLLKKWFVIETKDNFHKAYEDDEKYYHYFATEKEAQEYCDTYQPSDWSVGRPQLRE